MHADYDSVVSEFMLHGSHRRDGTRVRVTMLGHGGETRAESSSSTYTDALSIPIKRWARPRPTHLPVRPAPFRIQSHLMT